jgi:excisionase family DNA binding protein
MENTTTASNRDASPSLLKLDQVATDLNVSKTTVYELIRSGKLQTVKIGKAVRVPTAEIARLIEALKV